VNESADTDEENVSGSAPEPHPSEVCASLLDKMQTLQLASIDDNDWPYCSYAPFLHNANSFYVFISELAAHTRHVLDTGKAALMIAADEADSAQIFARTRVYYQCVVEQVPRTLDDQPNPDYARLLDAYEQRHGKTVALLRSLADFHLVRFTPRTGLFVMGFGQAYKLSGPELSDYTHVRSA